MSDDGLEMKRTVARDNVTAEHGILDHLDTPIFSECVSLINFLSFLCTTRWPFSFFLAHFTIFLLFFTSQGSTNASFLIYRFRQITREIGTSSNTLNFFFL